MNWGQVVAGALGTGGLGITVKELFKWANSRSARKDDKPTVDFSLMQKGNTAAMEAVLQSLATAKQDAADARERATKAEERADTADQRADESDRRADMAERKVASLEIRLDAAEETVRRLERTVASLATPGANPDSNPGRRSTDKTGE